MSIFVFSMSMCAEIEKEIVWVLVYCICSHGDQNHASLKTKNHSEKPKRKSMMFVTKITKLKQCSSIFC